MHESHGIGLSICKRIAESLGGELVYVQQNFGCRFDLKIRTAIIEQTVFDKKALEYL
jgi:signal transduction histidine kinase